MAITVAKAIRPLPDNAGALLQPTTSQEDGSKKTEPLLTPVGDPWPRPYFIRDGLRRVAPYHFTYNTYCKERWRGREVLDVFTSEFRDRPPEYYKQAIENGSVMINAQRIPSPTTKVRNGDLLTHTLHRHEPPVTAEDIGIVHEDNDLIVINKPAGIPVHPTGRYNYNSVTEILRSMRSYSFNPLPCNRLDRLTSGVMFIGKHPAAADKITVAIKQRSVRKEYLARVVGEFPEGEVVVDKPILQISPRLGLNQVRANGKEAKTVFRRLAYYPSKDEPTAPSSSAASAEDTSNASQLPTDSPTNPDKSPTSLPWTSHRGHSIVHCLPLTGRTHQIRVHLQYLGHPISNDPIYANQRVFGPNLDAGIFREDWINDNAAGIADDVGAVALPDSASASTTSTTTSGTADDTPSNADTAHPPASSGAAKARRKRSYTLTDQSLITRLEAMGKHETASALAYHHSSISSAYENRKAEKLSGQMCDVCGTELYTDPGVHELGIYLHALRYEDLEGEWGFESGVPRWAFVERETGDVEDGGGAEGRNRECEKRKEEELRRRIGSVRAELRLPAKLERLDLGTLAGGGSGRMTRDGEMK